MDVIAGIETERDRMLVVDVQSDGDAQLRHDRLIGRFLDAEEILLQCRGACVLLGSFYQLVQSFRPLGGFQRIDGLIVQDEAKAIEHIVVPGVLK